MKCMWCEKPALFSFLPLCAEHSLLFFGLSMAQLYLEKALRGVKKAYVYEEGGVFYLTDKFGLRTIRFNTEVERQTWIDNFKKETGKPLLVLTGKPDAQAALKKNLLR